MFKLNSAFQVLYVKDIIKVEEFYKALGVEIVELEINKVVINLGSYNIHFIKDDTEPWDEYKYIAVNNSRGNGIIFYIEVDELDNIFSKVINAKGIIKSPIKANWWGAKEFLFEDPNGYKYVFYKMN